MKSKEFWRVEIHSKKHLGDLYEYYVYAISAAIAEKRGLEIAKRNGVEKPYCYSASFQGYIE